MPYDIIKIPRKVLMDKEIKTCAMSFKDEYTYNEVLRYKDRLEREDLYILTRIDDICFVWCRYVIIQSDTCQESINKAKESNLYEELNNDPNGFIISLLQFNTIN